MGDRLQVDFRYVYKSVDAGGEIDEGAELRQAHDGSLDHAPRPVGVDDVVPGVRCRRLDREGDLGSAVLLFLYPEHLDADHLSDGQDVGGVLHAGMRNLGNVYKSVDAAQVDEGAEALETENRSVDFHTLAQL